MTVGLRKIKMSRWLDRPSDFPAGTVTADAVTDLRTTQNALSVFIVRSDDTAALRRIASAVTADATSLEHFEYFLFPLEGLASLGLEMSSAPGTTSDDVVNSWHRDIIALTGESLVLFASFLGGNEAGRLLKRDVAKELVVSLNEGRYTRSPKCQKDLDRLWYSST